MQGDLHHLYTCQFQCNSFRGNRPYTDFGKYDIVQEAERQKCGFSEDGLSSHSWGRERSARATLYFLLRYGGQFENMYDEVEDGLATLLKWHEKAPVTEHELHRNQAISRFKVTATPSSIIPNGPGNCSKRDGSNEVDASIRGQDAAGGNRVWIGPFSDVLRDSSSVLGGWTARGVRRYVQLAARRRACRRRWICRRGMVAGFTSLTWIARLER